MTFNSKVIKFFLCGALGLILGWGSPAESRNLLSDAPFPWGAEQPIPWRALNGTWRIDLGPTKPPLILEFQVTERSGDLFLISTVAGYEGWDGVAQGHGFGITGQRHLNIVYLGQGVIPLGVFRAFPDSYAGPMSSKLILTATWLQNVNSNNFSYDHVVMEKISDTPSL